MKKQERSWQQYFKHGCSKLSMKDTCCLLLFACEHLITNSSSRSYRRDEGLTSVSTWTLTFNWLSLYWFALETCSSMPHSTASHPVHLRESRRRVSGRETDDWDLNLGAGTQRWDWPFLQRVDYVRKLVGAQVAAHAAVYLHLLVPLVQFALDDVTINGLDQQVLQLPHILQLKLLQEQRVRQALRG